MIKEIIKYFQNGKLANELQNKLNETKRILREVQNIITEHKIGDEILFVQEKNFITGKATRAKILGYTDKKVVVQSDNFDIYLVNSNMIFSINKQTIGQKK